MISFLLNGQAVSATPESGDLTLLRYLRKQHSLNGTKEGCASGDCGACTVLLGKHDKKGEWRYQAINSCITLMPQVHGCNIITVEGLAIGAHLHPAQQAMVAYHGSQCGYCTPGIVMSLAALYAKHPQGSDFSLPDIQDALSGNLCRCTGYQPILEAAAKMASYAPVDQARIWQPVIASPETSYSEHYWIPESELELKALLREHPDARIVAGATDLALEVTQMNKHLPKLISLHALADLQKIVVSDTHLSLGAAVTYQQAEETLHQYYPEFGALLDRLGSRQIRNAGTIGGNIANASPVGDTPPVLIALDAQIEVVELDERAENDRTHWLPLDTFFLDYKKTRLAKGAYIRSIKIPLLKPTQHLKVYKISKRLEDDISAVLMALRITLSTDAAGQSKISDVRSGFGGMAAIPKTAPALEASLIDQPLSEASFISAGTQLENDFQPLSDVRASAHYRLEVCKGLLLKCAMELMHPAAVTRIEQVSDAPQTTDVVQEPPHA